MSRVADTRAPALARLQRSFTILVIVLYAGFLVRTISDSPHNAVNFAAIGGLLAGSSVVLAWLARKAWESFPSRPVGWALGILLGYHAPFGCVLLTQRILTEATRNDDLAARVWPHVIHCINSLE
ncbi:MAG: hypothetical protein JNK02_10990 [Planctomycetes bacterium]|nr:hypothetical protein [Planctomycetota bacterium]